MKKITNELDKIASQIENHSGLNENDRLIIAKMLDEVSDNLENIEKQGNVLMRDKDEKFMDRYDELGVVDGQSDEDEEYMNDYENTVGREGQGVREEYERKHKPGYETRDLNTDKFASKNKLQALLSELKKRNA